MALNKIAAVNEVIKNMFYILFGVYIILTCCGLTLLKIGGQETSVAIGSSSVSMNFNYLFLIGLICYIFSFFLFTVILQKKNLSIIYPLSAGAINILSIVIGVVILKEKLTIFGSIGIALIVLGSVLISIKA